MSEFEMTLHDFKVEPVSASLSFLQPFAKRLAVTTLGDLKTNKTKQTLS